MSDATVRNWGVPEEERPWPNCDSIQRGLVGLGMSIDRLRVKPLGGRTLGATIDHGGLQTKLSLIRQRCPNSRIVCPLSEEYEALRTISRVNPDLVPEPMGMIEGNGTDALVVLSWVGGRRVGSPKRFREENHLIAEGIFSTLSSFHQIGSSLNLGSFTRVIRVDRLLKHAEESTLRGKLIMTTVWDRAVASATALSKQISHTTLLHGDPHAYNLIENASGYCWLDFEQLSVGPPEFDLARAWVLFQAQSQARIRLPWESDDHPNQLVCRFLATVGFLEGASTTWSIRSQFAVRMALRSAIDALL